MMKPVLKSAVLAFVAISFAGACFAATAPEGRRKKKIAPKPVYDTIRVVVTDTVRIAPVAPPRERCGRKGSVAETGRRFARR